MASSLLRGCTTLWGLLVLVALCGVNVQAGFEFPELIAKPIKEHALRVAEFFPVNRYACPLCLKKGNYILYLRPGEETSARAAPKVESRRRGGGGGKTEENPEAGVPAAAAFSHLPTMLGSVYLFSAICFILCLRGLSTPETAKRGNILG